MSIIETSGVVVLKRSELDAIIDATARKAVGEAIARMPRAESPRPLHVTQGQAAEILRISRATVSKMVKSGNLTLNACGMIPISQIDKALGND